MAETQEKKQQQYIRTARGAFVFLHDSVNKSARVGIAVPYKMPALGAHHARYLMCLELSRACVRVGAHGNMVVVSSFMQVRVDGLLLVCGSDHTQVGKKREPQR